MLAFSSVLIIGMLIVTIVIVKTSQTIQTREANKMLINAAKREANLVGGIFNEIYVALNASKHFVMRDVHQGKQAVLDNDVIDMLNSNTWGSFGYLYLKDSRYRGENILNPKYRLPMVIL